MDPISYFQGAILGLLQGFAELFPVPSLGHSVILPRLLGWNIHQNDGYFVTFLVATATAVVLFVFFLEDWKRILTGMGRTLRDRGIGPRVSVIPVNPRPQTCRLARFPGARPRDEPSVPTLRRCGRRLMSDATDRDEDDWLGRVAAGDRGDALVALYRAYAPRIHRLGLRTLRDTGHAEELVQETFVRLWQSAHRFDPKRGSARAFTFTIAQRVAIDFLRRASARPQLAAAVPDEALGMSTGDEDTVERIADEFLVREALETLSPKHREVITMSFDQDLADGQIADRLGVPVGTVRSRTYYALRAMRLELEERGLLA